MLIWTPRNTRTGIVTLSGEPQWNTSNQNPCGIRINADGTVDKLENVTYTQLDASTDWIIPNSAANGVYQVRITNVVDVGGTDAGFNDEQAAAEDTWISLSSNRQWSCVAVGATGADSVGYNFDVQIRYAGGPVLATGNYEFIAEGIP